MIFFLKFHCLIQLGFLFIFTEMKSGKSSGASTEEMLPAKTPDVIETTRDAYLVIHIELKRGIGKKNSIFIGWFN